MKKPRDTGDKPLHLPLQVWKEREGVWKGKKRLWLSPGEPELNSDSRAHVAISDDQRHLEIDYDWVFKERRQTAVITALLKGNGKAEMKWSDTFHTSGAGMPLRGRVAPDGLISVRGTYDEEWGWRIDVDPRGARSFRLAMYNVTPEKKEELAVEIVFRRETE